MTLRLTLRALLLLHLAACSSIITRDSIAESGAPRRLQQRILERPHDRYTKVKR